MLTKEAILSANDLKRETVNVPEWGGDVLIQEMSGAQRDAYEAHITDTGEDMRKRTVRARYVAFSIIGEDGEPMFSVDDVEALAKKNAKALDRVFAAAAELNIFTEDAVKEAEGN